MATGTAIGTVQVLSVQVLSVQVPVLYRYAYGGILYWYRYYDAVPVCLYGYTSNCMATGTASSYPSGRFVLTC